MQPQKFCEGFEYAKKGFLHMGAKISNELPPAARISGNAGAQLGGGSWGSRPLPFSANEQTCPFCSTLSISKRVFP